MRYEGLFNDARAALEMAGVDVTDYAKDARR